MLASIAAIIVCSILGVPGLVGFVSQSLLIIGSYSVSPWAVLCTAIATLLYAYALFGFYRHIFLGTEKNNVEFLKGSVQDLSLREKLCLIPILILIVTFGIYPKPIVDLVSPSLVQLLSAIK